MTTCLFRRNKLKTRPVTDPVEIKECRIQFSRLKEETVIIIKKVNRYIWFSYQHEAYISKIPKKKTPFLVKQKVAKISKFLYFTIYKRFLANKAIERRGVRYIQINIPVKERYES